MGVVDVVLYRMFLARLPIRTKAVQSARLFRVNATKESFTHLTQGSN